MVCGRYLNFCDHVLGTNLSYFKDWISHYKVDGELQLAPGFVSPPNSDYLSYHQYIDDFLPPESPVLYGLHPNAEISSLTTAATKLFKTVLEMQPRDTGGEGGTAVSREEKVTNRSFFKFGLLTTSDFAKIF